MIDYDCIYLLCIPLVMSLALTVSRELKPAYWYLIVLVFLVAQVLFGLSMRGYSERFWLNTTLFSVLPFGLVALTLRAAPIRHRPVLMVLLGTPIFWLGAILGMWIGLGMGYGP